MSKTIDSKYLKVTSKDNMVWVVDGERLPKETLANVEDFLALLVDEKIYKRIRITASENNYVLITRLFKLKLDGLIESIQLATPALEMKGKPASSLMRMRLCTLPPSLGGWHEMTNDDYIVYTLARLMFIYNNAEFKKKKDGSYTVHSLKEIENIQKHVSALMTSHSIWKYVSFLDNFNPMAMADVISSICDPRWFMDPDRPDRMSKLFSWMGLFGHSESKDKARRSISLKACWLNNYVEFKHDDSIVKKMMSDPSNFIIKNAYDKWGPDDNKWIDNKVSKLFLKYIKLSWMDCIYPYPNPWMEPMFIYSDMFKDEITLKAFKAHIKK